MYQPVFNAVGDQKIYSSNNASNNDILDLFHGSPEKITDILSSNPNSVGGTDFGGLFASPSLSGAESHGGLNNYLHQIPINENNILRQYDIDYSLDPNKVREALINAHPNINQDNVDHAWDTILGNKSQDEYNKIDEKYLGSDPDYQGWNAQALRGNVAKQLGYKAVEMPDEHGMSYLAFPGNPIRLMQDKNDVNYDFGRTASNGIPQSQGAYSALDDSILKSYPSSLKTLNDNFTQNPTFSNAHALQSQLGSLVGKLQANDAKGTLNMADRHTMENLQNARTSLLTDMDQYLQNADPNLANQYAVASQNWSKNVAPYMSQQAIAKAVNQNMNNTGNNAALTPEKLATALSKVGGNPVGLAEQKDALQKRIAFRNLAQRGAGALLGEHFLPGAGEYGGAIGYLLGRQLFKGFNNLLPPQLSQGLGAYSANIAPYIRQSLVADAIPTISSGIASTPAFMNDLQNK
jgi:hypothetical protein